MSDPIQVAKGLTDLPAWMEGHWDTPDGWHMATDQIGKQRADLCKGHVSDLALANAVFMASRHDLDLIVWQTAAKERIRWLSAQLALCRLQGDRP